MINNVVTALCKDIEVRMREMRENLETWAVLSHNRSAMLVSMFTLHCD